MAKQEAALRRLSSESTAPAPQRGTRRALTSRLRRRRASFPRKTVQSVPDATSSPSVDQEVPSVSHPMPFRFSFDPPSDPASVDLS
jgi:hypothetical protein